MVLCAKAPSERLRPRSRKSTASPQGRIPLVPALHLRLALELVASADVAESPVYWIVGKIKMVNGTKEFTKGLDTEQVLYKH